MKFLTFKIREETYCLNIDFIEEVIKFVEYRKVPGISDLYEGIFKLRDRVISVINMRKVMGIDELNETGYFIIIKNNKDELFALWVDNVYKIIEVEDNEFESQNLTIELNNQTYNPLIIKKENNLYISLDEFVKNILL